MQLRFERFAQSLWAYPVARHGARLVVVLLLGRFVFDAAEAFWVLGGVNYLLLLAGEALTVALVCFARDTSTTRLTPIALLAAFSASFYYLFFEFVPGVSLLPKVWAELIQVMGISVQIFAKLSLGRSFGLVPANRGIVTRGAYRFVRHPIYLGYFIAHVGYLLGAFSLHNLVVLMLFYALQIIRIHEEEKLLRRSSSYVEYTKRVRWRILPGVF
jgi:protein-S-isoprenylcysteine O-methyltransferase Ste14